MRQRSPAFFTMNALGVILLVAGIVYGLGSRYVQYKSVIQGSILHYLSADGTGYLQMESNPALYIVHEDNFSPKLPTLADSDTIYLVYDPAETTAIDEKSTIGTHLVGTASKVVAITEVDAAGKKTYATPEYVSNSQGYDYNQWPLGIGLLILGLLLIGVSFFLPKKKQSGKETSSTTLDITMEEPEQQPTSQQSTSPHGQPIQQADSQDYQTQPHQFQPMPHLNYSQQQPSLTPFGLPHQQPNSSGQSQQADSYDQSQPSQQFSSLGQYMKRQPSQQFSSLRQYAEPRPSEPPQEE